jgi:hypothetical protein
MDKKRLALVIIMSFFFLACAHAQQKIDYVFVSWHENTEPDLAGYKLYWGTDTLKFNVKDCKLNDFCILQNELYANLKYYFAVTAYDSAGNESAKSDIVSFIAREDSLAPIKPKIKEIKVLYEKDN